MSRVCVILVPLSVCRAARCVCGDVGMQTVLPAVGHRGVVTEALWSKMF